MSIVQDLGGSIQAVLVDNLSDAIDKAPFVVEQAALALLAATRAHREAVDALKDAEGALLLSGALNDKGRFPNEATREAHIRAATTAARLAVETAWAGQEAARIELQKQQHVRQALNRLAGIICAGLQEDEE